MKDYDVVIVGAGPAGVSTAAKTSELGLKTLLIDKRMEVGVPVRCGEYIPHEDEVKRMFPSSTHTSNLIELTKAFKQNGCEFVRFLAPSGCEYNLRFRAYVIDEEGFIKELANRAKKNGCEICLKTEFLAVDVEKSRLMIGKKNARESISFGVLIAADGSNSNVAKSLGLKTTSREDKALTIHNIIDEADVDAEVCEMYWNRDYSPRGYTWIIPKGEDLVNVGLGLRGKEGSILRTYLTHFIHDNPTASRKLRNGKILSTIWGAVPVGGPIPKTFYRNILIVGDAAGQVAAHVGGGIPSSVICGEIAGETSYFRVNEGTSLGEYEKVWKKELGEVLERSLILRRIGDLFIYNNKLIDLAFSAIGEGGLNRLIRCEIPNGIEAMLNKASGIKEKVEKIRDTFNP